MLPRIGFIGCGAFSTSCLYPCLRLLATGLEPYGSEPEVELVACCDMDERLATRNAHAFGFQRSYTDHRVMLEKEDSMPSSWSCTPSCSRRWRSRC